MEAMENQKNKTAQFVVKPRGLSGIVYYLDKAVKPAILCGTVIACSAVAVMMFLTFVSVAGRMAFELPVKGYFELIELSMLLMTVFAVGYTASQKGHIRVDILASYLPKKANRIVDIITYAVAFVFFVFVTWRGWVNGLDNLGDKLTSGVLHIPTYPFNFILAVGTAILALVFLRDFLKAIKEVKE
jgi:TRAP-type C4-dicarboxylate transport system permease small subunit